jgi:hypothetical protein
MMSQPMLNHQEANHSNNTTADANWHKPIIPAKPPAEIRKDPYNMPKGFEWIQVDVTDPLQCTEIYDLLYQNYVEDDGCTFRFDYSKDFLRWALTPPGYNKVRKGRNGFGSFLSFDRTHTAISAFSGISSGSTKHQKQTTHGIYHRHPRQNFYLRCADPGRGGQLFVRT